MHWIHFYVCDFPLPFLHNKSFLNYKKKKTFAPREQMHSIKSTPFFQKGSRRGAETILTKVLFVKVYSFLSTCTTWN